MRSQKDAARATEELAQLADQLHEELTEGDGEFERMLEPADRIGERAITSRRPSRRSLIRGDARTRSGTAKTSSV